jgi:hypothetical protein
MTATLLWADIVEISLDAAKQSKLLLLEDAGLPATSWQEGAIAPLLVEMTARFDVTASKYAVFFKTAFLNEAAQGEALTRLAASQYLNTRVPASPSTRRITLTCLATEGPYDIDIGESIVQHADGHTYRNIEGLEVSYPVTLASGGSVELLYECEVAGAQSNVADQTVSTIITTLAGVTITNDELEEEGVDEELDARLRARNSAKWSLLSRFETIDDAIQALALEASPNISRTAVDNLNPRGVGTFDVYIAGELTTASSADVNDMQAMLNRFIMQGDPLRARAYAAPPLVLDITGIVYYSSSAIASQVQAAVEASLEELLKAIPLGGFDFSPGPNHVVALNDIETAIKTALVSGQAYVRTVALSSPTGNVGVSSYGKVVRGAWNLTYTPTAG